MLDKHASHPCRLSNIDLEILPYMEEKKNPQQMTSPGEQILGLFGPLVIQDFNTIIVGIEVLFVSGICLLLSESHLYKNIIDTI